jgi:nitrite reductase (NO-forming)
MDNRGKLKQAMLRGGIGRAGAPAVAAFLTVIIAILGLGGMLASAQTATPTPCPASTPTSGTPAAKVCVVIDEYDIYFKPNLVTIPADSPVEISLTNHGVTAHTFVITDHGNSGLKNLNINVSIDPGKTTQTTINAPEGVYYFYCSVPGHEAAGMRGYLTVKKDAKISVSEATVTPRAG